jgi:predicted ArsR family transcriptional regulator
MSRGPGATKRGVLAALARYGPMNATELAQDIFGLWGTLKLEPTAVQLDSVRRAIRHLAARGLIVEYDRGSGRKYWQLPEPGKREGQREHSRAPQESAAAEAIPALADKFIKLLGMLSSEHAGERANAIAAAERLRKQYGITWRDIVRPAITRPP